MAAHPMGRNSCVFASLTNRRPGVVSGFGQGQTNVDKDESALRQLVDMALVGSTAWWKSCWRCPWKSRGSLRVDGPNERRPNSRCLAKRPTGMNPSARCSYMVLLSQGTARWRFPFRRKCRWRFVLVSSLESLILQWLIALDVYLGVLIAALSRTRDQRPGIRGMSRRATRSTTY